MRRFLGSEFGLIMMALYAVGALLAWFNDNPLHPQKGMFANLGLLVTTLPWSVPLLERFGDRIYVCFAVGTALNLATFYLLGAGLGAAARWLRRPLVLPETQAGIGTRGTRSVRRVRSSNAR